jgi:HSP20 family protein
LDCRPTLANRFFDDAFSRFFEDSSRNLTTRTWSPPVDVFEENGNVIISAELPGLEQKDVEINVENGRLTISGERTFEDRDKSKDYHRLERWYGKFFRSFQLPTSVDLSQIDAALRNGLLTVTIPKKEEAKPRQIKVKS